MYLLRVQIIVDGLIRFRGSLRLQGKMVVAANVHIDGMGKYSTIPISFFGCTACVKIYYISLWDILYVFYSKSYVYNGVHEVIKAYVARCSIGCQGPCLYFEIVNTKCTDQIYSWGNTGYLEIE